MSTIALINPTNLLGKEIRESLEQRRELWTDLRLLALDEAEVGALTDVAGAATLVNRLEDDDDLDGIGAAIFCGPIAHARPVLERLTPATTAIVASPDAMPDDGEPIVAGINLTDAARGSTLLSPHPAAVGLAHLLAPLGAYGLSQAVATLVQPASAHDTEGLDEVLNQTRRILSFQSDPPMAVFGAQLAFNLLPVLDGSDAAIPHLVRRVLGFDLALQAQTLQAGVFHGYGLSVFVELDDDPGAGALRAALDEHPALHVVDDPETLGPVRAAGTPDILVGDLRETPQRPGGYWLWAVLDNLVAGGARNVLQMLEAVSHTLTH